MGKKKIWDDVKYDLTFMCEGCECSHAVLTSCVYKGVPQNWNVKTSNKGKVTSRPSYFYDREDGYTHRCHYFITDGDVRYLPDCTHELRGKTVKNVEFF